MASISLTNLMILLAMVTASAFASNGENANILLEIKASLVDPTGSLKSWSQERSSTLCKDWYGITCDTTSSMIINISLSNKNLSGILSPAVGSLSSLQELNFSSNMLTGAVPVEITGCLSMRVLDLSNNNFTGELPIGFSQLTQLETLSLWTNSFIGPIPQDIVLCSKLKHLDLGGSYLEGEIPHAIGNLTNLVYLTLAGNDLSGDIPSSLKQLRKLEWIYIGYNQFTGSIPYEIGELTSLKHLDLVHNNLTGEFPVSLTNLTSLEYLFLYDNKLTGTIPPGIANLTKLLSLDLSSNMMSGSIPSGFSNLKQLQILNLFSNGFTGEIPHVIADIQTLKVLALWMNKLTGEVPAKLGLKNNLSVLDLSSNQLRGPIPEHLCASKILHNLILFTNYMSGPIPQSLANCHSLQRVRLEGNYFTGSFPQALTNLPLVYYLDLSSNNFSGRLDSFTWNMPSLQVLRLQGNEFNGSIPTSIENSKGLVTLDLSMNGFTGDIPLELGSLIQLNKLYLNDNMLSGVIQSGGLLMCRQLNDINLSNNQLSGPIPLELASMTLLSALDLSHNQFSGTIPPQLGDMDSLVFVNLSFNHLYGEVPLSGAFLQINASSIEGNPGLCGGSLRPCITVTKEHSSVGGSVKARVTAALFLIGLLIAVVGVGNMIWKIKHGDWGGKSIMKLKSMKNKAWGEWNLKLFQAVKPSVEEVLEAMQEENVVEKRSPCIVYKGKTKGGVQFAAMEMIESYNKNSGGGQLGNVLAVIGRLRHPNIVNVYGICCGTTSSIMVFELVEGCTRLSSLLERDCHAGVAFSWERRLHVAVEIAKAILHLQSSCSPPILHGSICSNNVLVDTAFVVRLLPPNTSRACLMDASNANKADEEGNWFASDIRAFGEVLLELMMGRNSNRALSPELHTSEERQWPFTGVMPVTAMLGTQQADELSRAPTQVEQQQVMTCVSTAAEGNATIASGQYGAGDAAITGASASRDAAKQRVAAASRKVAGAVITSMLPIHEGEVRQLQTPAGGGIGSAKVCGGAEAGEDAAIPTSMIMPAARDGMGTAAAGVQLAVELCRSPTQAKVRQVLRVLEGWRRRQSGGSCSPLK